MKHDQDFEECAMDFSSFMVFRPLTMNTIKFEPFFLPQSSVEWPSNKGPLGDFDPKFIPIVYGQPTIFILESQYLCIIWVILTVKGQSKSDQCGGARAF